METRILQNLQELQQVLQEIEENKASGALNLSNPYIKKRFNFADGKIMDYSNSNQGRLVGDLGVLVLELGMVSCQEIFQAFVAQRREKKHYCQLLCDQGLLSEQDLQAVINTVVGEEVCEVFTWEDGKYEISQQHFSSVNVYNLPNLRNFGLSVSISHILGKIDEYLDEWNQVKSQLGNMNVVLVTHESYAEETKEFIDTEIAFYGINEVAGKDKTFDAYIGQRLNRDLAYFRNNRSLKDILRLISCDRLRYCRRVLDLVNRDYLRSLRPDELLELAQYSRKNNQLQDAKKYYQLLVDHDEISEEEREKIQSNLESLDSSVLNSLASTQTLPTDYTQLEFPGYEIVEEIGRGAMGKVFKAKQKSLNREVAIKIVATATALSSNIYIKRLEIEAQAMAQLKHPNIVSAIDFGYKDNYYYIVMEYIKDGKSLLDLIRSKGNLPDKEVYEIGYAIAKALRYMQENRLIHRDIKPGNILLDRDGTPKLADLGLIKDLDSDMQITMPGASVGTPAYMSPEQLQTRKDLDIRTDIYSLGATLLHAATGKVRFKDTFSAGMIYHKIVSEPLFSVKDFGEVSATMDRILTKMLQPERENRYQTSKELLEDLEKAMSGKRLQATTPKKGTLKWIVAVCLLLVGLGGITFTPLRQTLQKFWQPPPTPKQAIPEKPPLTVNKPNPEQLLSKVNILYEAKQYAQVVAECTALLQKDEKLLRAYYLRGYSRLNLGQIREAETDFDQLIAKDGESHAGFIGKAYIYYLQKKYATALRIIATDKLEKQNAEFYYLRARIYMQMQRFSEAKQDLSVAVKKQRDFWQAYYLMSVLNCQKNPQNALENLDIAIENGAHQASENVLAWINYYKGILLHKLNKYPPAQRAFEEALGYENSREIAARLGLTMLEQNKFELALRHLSNALSLRMLGTKGTWQIDVNLLNQFHMPLAQIYYERGRAQLGLNQEELALQEFTTALRTDSKYERARKARFKIYVRQNDTTGILKDSNFLLQIYPEQDPYRWERAKILVKKKKYRQAIDDLSVLLKKSYRQQEVLQLRLQAYLQTSDDQAALADVNALLRLLPKDPDLLEQRGLLFEKQGNIRSAVRDYHRTVKYDPMRKNVYKRLIAIYKKYNKQRQLAKVYKKLLAIDSQNVDALYSSAQTHMKQGQYSQAIRGFSQVLSADPQSEPAYFYRAMCNYSAGNTQAALIDFSKSISLKPDRFEAYYYRGLIFEQNREYQSAINNFSKFLQFNLQHAEALLARARCRLQLKQYKQAIPDLERTTTLAPNFKALQQLASCYMKQRNYQKALQTFNRAVQYGNLDAQNYNDRGYCYAQFNQWDNAIADYRQAVRLNPNFALAQMNLGTSLYAKNRYQEAIQAISIAIQIEPNNQSAYLNRGKIYLKIEDYSQAIANYTNLLAINPSSAESYYYRGYAHYKLKQFRRAIADFQKTVRLQPLGPLSTRARRLAKNASRSLKKSK